MAKQIVLVTPDTDTSDATFRATFSPISTALQALFVKVTQAGEIDWGTVTKPSSGNSAAGFEVYRFNDAMQATAPIFFKIEYGSGAAIQFPAIWLTVGKGADGAGNITSVLLPRALAIVPGYGPTLTAKNCYVGNGDGSCLVMSLFPSDAAFQASSGSVLILERSRDSNGNATGDGIHRQYSANVSSNTTDAVDYVTGNKNTTEAGCVPIPYTCASGVSLSNGVNTPIFTGMVMTPARASWVPTAIVGCAQAEFGVGVVASALVNGIDYLALGAASAYADMTSQQYSASLLRWD